MCAHAAYFWGGSLQLAADSVQVEVMTGGAMEIAPI